ncbi:MAG: NAD(P)H-dependent glycerol-3-phosphate dehydrogenase [Pseudomonadota bacterium]
MGAGSWGTALASLACKNFSRVRLWSHRSQILEDIAETGENRSYLPGIELQSNIIPSPDLEDIVGGVSRFIVVVPSHAFRQTCDRLQRIRSRAGSDLDPLQLVWGTKGFEPDSGLLLSQVAAEIFPEDANFGVVSGPSFAKETTLQMPTALTVACRFEGEVESVCEWFRTATTRVYGSDDLIGVQLGGAIKNVMAIAAGIGDGLGYGANARAALITRGLVELNRLCKALGGKPETIMGLTGVGDLVLTCTDNQSRNRRFGMGLGAGKSIQAIKEEIGQEIEGINTTQVLFNKSKDLNLTMPITEQVYQIIFEGKNPAHAVNSLLQRTAKSENE